MIIQYKIREVYGTEKFYPCNENANMICKMLGQKTLTDANLHDLAANPEIQIERVRT